MLPAESAGRSRRPGLMLLIATAAWAFSFVWVKQSTDALNAAAGLGDGALFGSAALTSARFGIAAILWFAIFPASRRGWTKQAMRSVALLGMLLGAAQVLQTIGLDLTTETISAFLTSLTVIFVPLLTAIMKRRPPRRSTLLAIALAAAGVYLLTGASFSRFGAGEWLGLACSLLFSIHLIALHRVGQGESPWRLGGGQFAWVAIAVGASAVVGARPIEHFDVLVLLQPVIWVNLLLLVVVCTLLSFGLMNFFQPQVEPTRATMIYLLEPVFASAVAWWLAGRTMTALAITGAGLILLANAVSELPTRSPTGRDAPRS